MNHEFTGHLDKMRIHPGSPLEYFAIINEQEISLNSYLGNIISLEWLGEIHCRHCAQATKKSFNQGYCYNCFIKLAECDSCIMSPEKCHFHLGTCRDPAWGARVCFNDHIVYLANSSGMKVGITRMKNMPSRWLDQGAKQALPIARVASRVLAGRIEDCLRGDIADKTNWRALLKEEAVEVDLIAERDRLMTLYQQPLNALELEYGPGSVSWLLSESVRQFQYPVNQYPTKVVSLNLDKTPKIEGRLLGLKGQYLILDSGVINLRKYGAYLVKLSLSGSDNNADADINHSPQASLAF